MTVRWRWILVVVVLLVATAIAVWPRGQSSTQADLAVPTPDLNALRQTAALPACPQSHEPRPTGKGVLAGVKVTCMADGSEITLGGGPMLVNFWEPWCVPCRTELPALQEYAARPGAIPVLLVEIPSQSDQAGGLDLLGSLKIKLPSVWDPNASVANALGKPNVFPVTYVVAADGPAKRVATPAFFETADQVEQAVRQYANGSVTG
ncbi:TlpA family protein disulfide reductase [Kutzneria sp. CA-103260]|uniref:TlpA family protein disulfide reductase n=1 Tax=Kutzneria sp. CA-103260 TaxID=2802641 RepID=UPI001BA5AF71|nr:TlpA disulfide reductase family protein [Kutzneria sp. CA-103260]QUQ69724.1 Thiol-disulfide oxidoreductase ResA [Kutzneria sp. CA-103260]